MSACGRRLPALACCACLLDFRTPSPSSPSSLKRRKLSDRRRGKGAECKCCAGCTHLGRGADESPGTRLSCPTQRPPAVAPPAALCGAGVLKVASFVAALWRSARLWGALGPFHGAVTCWEGSCEELFPHCFGAAPRRGCWPWSPHVEQPDPSMAPAHVLSRRQESPLPLPLPTHVASCRSCGCAVVSTCGWICTSWKRPREGCGLLVSQSWVLVCETPV